MSFLRTEDKTGLQEEFTSGARGVFSVSSSLLASQGNEHCKVHAEGKGHDSGYRKGCS